MKKILLEVIADSVEDALTIESCGADRIELVSALSEGGVTPSLALVEQTVKAVALPVMVMIRPHARSFCYSETDLSVMRRDIALAREAGAAGVVLGCLNEEGLLAEKTLSLLLEECGGLEVTFHRAIDKAADPLETVRILRSYPRVKRVLTSGGQGAITENCELLRRMVSENGPKILAGSGLTAENIKEVIDASGVDEVHVGTAVRELNSTFLPVERRRLEELRRILRG